MIVRTAMGTVGLDTAGAGEPVLLLHGFPHDRALWAPQLAHPTPGFAYLAPDLPGYGESARATPPHLDTWADWAAALLDALGLDRVVVGGLSMGGYLAFALWRRHPGRVRALVLADTRAGPDTDEGRAKRRELLALVRSEGPAAVVERMRTGMVGRTTRRTRPAVVAALDAMMARAGADAVADSLQALMDRPDSTPTLATIGVPTLVVCGHEDLLTPEAEARAMHAAIPGSRVAILPHAGHVSNLEDPDAFNALLSEFLMATIRVRPS